MMARRVVQRRLLALALLVCACRCAVGAEVHWNVLGVGGEPELRLAAADAARYLRLLRCGHGPASAACVSLALFDAPAAVAASAAAARAVADAGGAVILVTTAARVAGVLGDVAVAGAVGAELAALTGDAHVVAPLGAVTLCAGATPRAALYAVYTLLEAMGARFYLHGDVLPAPRAALELPSARLRGDPAFSLRGIQPFHDFPMGPDWWSVDYYKLVGSQMAKMKMNLWGFHTYPFYSAGPEPAVWVGVASGYDAATGNVTPAGAYSSSWYLTEDFPRGNVPGSVSLATSQYCCGAAGVFPRDCYGSPAQAAECWPAAPGDDAAVLNGASALLQDGFAWGAAAGVGACLGAEVPLTPPPGSNASLRELYEGMFGRVAAATPAVGCFWLWTTEAVEDHSTGKGYPQSNPLWAQLRAEIAVAVAARDAVAPHLVLGTSGWCLGPGDNSSYFDDVVGDPSFTIGSIVGCLGWCDVDAGYAGITRHAGIAIPWMEDDLGLAGGELWVGRTLDQARAAAGYGATGLLGLLWRTWETAPQLAALATAGWDRPGNLTTAGVYADFCSANFGPGSAGACADLFMALDGATEEGQFSPPASRLPRGGQGCCGGPLYPAGGGGEGPPQFLNTTDWEGWAANVSGAANAERAWRWVGLFQYHAAMAVASDAGAALAAAAARVHDEASAREIGFPALAAASWAWAAMETALLAITTTPGELGILAAHEGANWPSNFYAAAGPILPYIARCEPYDGAGAGCYWDNYTVTGRVLPYTVTLSSPGNSREWCGQACTRAGFPLSGVEFGVACFCGGARPPAAYALPLSACAAMPCAGAPSEACGSADVISVFPSACPPAPGVPPGLLPPSTYGGPRRLWLTTPRTTAAAAEVALAVEAAVLAAAPPDAVTLTWWTVPGPATNASLPLAPVAAGRGLWAARVPLPADAAVVLEYVVTATWTGGSSLVVPVEGAQTVVVV